MTHAGIECFLAVCRYKTGSRAAEALCITQPSLSARLKTLERELGGTLFSRRKGSREMVLTAAGREFYKLALQYEQVVGQMSSLFHRNAQNLRVSSLNSLGTYLLPEVYDLFLQRYPSIGLEIQDKEFPGAGRSVMEGETDLAFSTGHFYDHQLERKPAFTEPMVLVCNTSAPYYAPVAADRLPPQQEVYTEWSSQFAAWHHDVFGDQRPQIRVSIMAQLQQFLEHGPCWAIVPLSVAEGLSRTTPIRIVEAAFPMPRREVSVYSLKQPNSSEAIQAFFQCLRQAVARYPGITCLL